VRRLALLTALLVLTGCGERKSSTGWAAQVPEGALRFVEQQVEAPKVTPPVEPQPDAAEAQPEPEPVSKVTEPTTITLWHAYRATERKALEQVVEAFHALKTPITVKLRVVPFDAFNDKIKVVVPEDRGPDVFIFAHDLAGAWSEMGFLEPLNAWTRPEHMAKFIPDTVKAMVYRNALYGLPMNFKCVALFYNKALVKTPPATVEAMIAEAKRHTDAEEDKFGLVYESTNLYFHAPWVHGFGGTVLDGDDKVYADNEAAVAALDFARSLIRTHEVTPSGINTSMVSGYFNDGLAAMVINGPWMRGELEGIDYGVTLLPAVKEGQPARPFLGVEAIYMNKRSPSKQAAFEVMRFLTSDAAAAIRVRVGQQTVANKAIWDGELVDDVMRAFRAQSKQAVVMSSSPRMQQVWTPYNGALLSVIAGEARPAAALGKAQRQIEADMARAGGGQ